MEEQLLVESKRVIAREKPVAQVTGIKVSAIVTGHNFGDSIREVYASLVAGLNKIEKNIEIVFVDDGSTDNTWELLRTITENDSRVKSIRLRSTSGEAAAFDAGLEHSSGENIIFITTRKRLKLEAIQSFINKLDGGFDLVMGWRYPRSDSKLNQIISKIFNWMVKIFYHLNLHDINSGIFVARRAIFDEVTLYGDMNIFLPIIAATKGFKVTEAKIEQLHGRFPRSKFVTEYIQRVLDLITVIFLMKYSKKPLHFLGFLGLIFTIAGAAMNIYLFVYRILKIGGIAGRPLLLLGALLMVIGIQMISIGLIGEIIIFTHARNLKEYSIEIIIE